jgi:hypothetical protein
MNFNMETMVSLSFMINVVLIIFVYRIHKHTDRMSRQMENIYDFLWDDIKNKKDMGKM